MPRSQHFRRNLWRAARGECHWCGRKTHLNGPRDALDLATIDHVYDRNHPYRIVDLNSPKVLACRSCNEVRGILSTCRAHERDFNESERLHVVSLMISDELLLRLRTSVAVEYVVPSDAVVA